MKEIIKTICPKCGKEYTGAPALSRLDNTTLVCPDCGKPTRVGHAIVDGKKARVCKKCGASLDKQTKAVVKKEKKVARKTKKTEEAPVAETAEATAPAKKTARKTKKAEE